MKGLNQIAAFYNARLQGYAKIYDAFKQRPARAFTMITGSIILPSIYFWLANKDDPIYQRQPEWVKNNYWVVVHDGVPYRISKPFDLGVVFGTGTEQLLDWLNKEHPDEINDFIYDFGISQLKNINPIPTFAAPVIETYMNKSFLQVNLLFQIIWIKNYYLNINIQLIHLKLLKVYQELLTQ